MRDTTVVPRDLTEPSRFTIWIVQVQRCETMHSFTTQLNESPHRNVKRHSSAQIELIRLSLWSEQSLRCSENPFC